MTWRVITADVLDGLARLEDGSVQTCVTSPPYYGLRDYGDPGQIGLESTPDEYVARLVGVFREVRRVLRDDGTLWLNLGDSYAAHGAGAAGKELAYMEDATARKARAAPPGVKPKDLLGIPWMVAFALRADGWYLRSDIIWAKPNPMPESVTDRPTKAHEYLFLLSKAARYYYDARAIAEGVAESTPGRLASLRLDGPGVKVDASRNDAKPDMAVGNGTSRNRRSVWTVPTQPFPGAHFAVFPPKLIEPCVLAGGREGDTVLDPFSGAGTTGVVVCRLERDFVGIELNAGYAEMARQRIRDDGPLLNVPSEVAA